jgi:UDP-glucuronate 4-epimerase
MGHVLEGCRQQQVEHLVYASSSSVYGGNRNLPFSERQPVNHPVSLYAATKKANELMAHTYSHLYGLPATGLRFFTVYGPWGRPDMAPMKFAKAILAGMPIDVYNHGDMQRDFTFVDDLIEAIMRLIPAVPQRPVAGSVPMTGDSLSPVAPFRVVNIGNSRPLALLDFIAAMEHALGAQAQRNFLPMQAGDVPDTYANVADLVDQFKFKPQTTIEEGINAFVNWYRDYTRT